MIDCTLGVESVRCRLVLVSDELSSVEMSFDGDNESEDTVRLIRFF